MELDWVTIPDFPNYLVSNYGDVVNATSGRWMAQSLTTQGVVKVGLISGTTQRTRSVSGLVARAFVSGRDDICDTVVHLDGNPSNNRADNLVWRPRWFTWRYTSQLRTASANDRIGPIRSVGEGTRYVDVYECATSNGLLMEDIRKSIVLGEPCFPTLQRFQMI
jgi:hypothetical protein